VVWDTLPFPFPPFSRYKFPFSFTLLILVCCLNLSTSLALFRGQRISLLHHSLSFLSSPVFDFFSLYLWPFSSPCTLPWRWDRFQQTVVKYLLEHLTYHRLLISIAISEKTQISDFTSRNSFWAERERNFEF
jgi:hypothetical protein